MADGKTASEKRYGKTFDGPSIPFETLVEYIPITAKDKSIIHQFGQKTLKGRFSGYVLRAGRVWSGDLMIADYEDLQKSEASEMNVKDFKNQEVFVKEDYEFQCAKGTLKLPDRPRPSSTAEKTLSEKMMLKSKKATERELTQKIHGS